MSDFDPADIFGLRRGSRGPRGPRVIRPRGSLGRGPRILIGVGVAALVLVFLFFALLGLRVQYLFLDSLGHTTVFWTPLVARVLCGLVGFVVTGGIVAGCIPVAGRAARTLDERARGYAIAAGILLAVLAGLGGATFLGSQWETILLGLHRHDFGAADPVFGQDFGFFVFTLPLYDALQGIVWGGLVVGLLGTLAVGGLCLALEIAPDELPLPLTPPHGSSPRDGMRLATLQSGVLVAAILLMAALGAHFGVYHLATDQHDAFVGLDATQRDVGRPILGLLQWVAVGLAILTVALLVRRRHGDAIPTAIAVGGVLGGWLVLAGLLQAVPAAIYSAAHVNPNAATVQLPPISDYLSTSRVAWGLDPGTNVDTRQFGPPPPTGGSAGQSSQAATAVTVQDLAADPQVLRDTRVQDTTQLPEILNNIDRSRRSYQTYPRVTVDRYAGPDGRELPVMLGPREIEESNLPSQTFANQTFVFTHGAGVSAVSVNQLDQEGNPQILASVVQGQNGGPVEQLAAGAPPALAVTDPRIYCGLQTTLPVVVNTSPNSGHSPEFDGAGTDAFSTYGDGGSGIPVPGALDRLALSLDQFHGLDLFLTSSTTAQSRVLLHRQIADRVSQVAPWLTLDGDPYIVADSSSGHYVFVVDAYVNSADFPDSFRLSDGTSYQRNAVKAVVDARTCQTTLYAVDLSEPLTAAYNDIYPGVLTPLDSMPMALRAHLRYPEQLFSNQAAVFTAAHIDPRNPSNLFTKTDLYRVADESTANYVELTLPGDTTPSFVLLQTFSPNASTSGSANNMVEWFTATCDYTHTAHPKLVAVPLAGGNYLGPKQFDQNLNTDATISPQLTLLGQNGSRTILGNTVVLPINNRAFLYVRPFYVQAAGASGGGGGFPQVRYVLVGKSDRVALGTSFASALQTLFGQVVPGAPPPEGAPPPTPSPSPGASPSPSVSPGPSSTPTGSGGPSPAASGGPTPLTLSGPAAAVLQDLLDAQQAAQRDLAARDFSAYGQDEARIEKDLDQLRQSVPGSAATGGTPSATSGATSTPSASVPTSAAAPSPSPSG